MRVRWRFIRLNLIYETIIVGSLAYDPKARARAIVKYYSNHPCLTVYECIRVSNKLLEKARGEGND